MSAGNKAEKKIPRPLNAFMLFANDHRAEFRRSHPGETNSKISVRLGESWKQLNGKEKTKYYQLSKKAEIEHRSKYPDYMYCPKEARSCKRARREEKGAGTEKCGKAADTAFKPQGKSGSRVQRPNVQPEREQPAKTECREIKPVTDQGGAPQNRRELWQYGQGDQMPPYPPYGPQYLPPLGYPRFPCWDFRPHPYMVQQYGQMPFMPHPMMYPCPVPQQAYVGTPKDQQTATESKGGLSVPTVSSVRSPTEEGSDLKTVDVSQIQQTRTPATNSTVGRTESEAQEQKPVAATPNPEPVSQTCHQGIPLQGNAEHPYSVSVQYQPQPYFMGMLAPESGPIACGMNPQPLQYVYKTPEDSHVVDNGNKCAPVAKTFADLSSGHAEIITVPTNVC